MELNHYLENVDTAKLPYIQIQSNITYHLPLKSTTCKNLIPQATINDRSIQQKRNNRTENKSQSLALAPSLSILNFIPFYTVCFVWHFQMYNI